MRRATACYGDRIVPFDFISIHALREESDLADVPFMVIVSISIHALREESDGMPHSSNPGSPTISIHALREESDM